MKFFVSRKRGGYDLDESQARQRVFHTRWSFTTYQPSNGQPAALGATHWCGGAGSSSKWKAESSGNVGPGLALDDATEPETKAPRKNKTKAPSAVIHGTVEDIRKKMEGLGVRERRGKNVRGRLQGWTGK